MTDRTLDKEADSSVADILLSAQFSPHQISTLSFQPLHHQKPLSNCMVAPPVSLV